MRSLSLSRSLLWVIAQCLVFLLLIVWQVPGTIGLRYGLLGLLLLVTLVLLNCRSQNGECCKKRWTPLAWLATLTGWMVVVIIGWGQTPSVSWSEFRGQWASALGAGLVGLLLAQAAIKDSERQVQKLLMAVFWGLASQVLLHDLLGALYWLATETPPFRQAPVLYLPELISTLWSPVPWQTAFTGNSPDKFSYVNNVLAALLVADMAQRILLKKRWLMCSNVVLAIVFLAVLLCSYWLQMRNGNVGLLLLLTLAGLMMTLRFVGRFGPLRVFGGLLAIGLTLAALGFAMVRSDPRWNKLADTIPIALDTQTNRTWLTMNKEYPKMTNGEEVDVSAYERVAWAKEGAVLVMENPWGTGYNRLAYGAGIDRKYQMNGTYHVHAHSGVIDFTIANGMPGLLLWLGFLGSLFYVGWQSFRGEQVGLGLTLMFLITGFMGRSLVDSNIRDHILQQFFFLAMLFYGLAEKDRVRVSS